MSPIERQIDFWGKIFTACVMGIAAYLVLRIAPFIPLPF